MKNVYFLRLLLLSVLMLTAINVCHAVRYTPDPDKVTHSVNVRSGKSSTSAIMGTINRGETFEVIALQGQWALIEYQGKKGYVNANYLLVVPEPVTRQEEVKEEGGVFKLLNMSYKGVYDVRWMVWLILGLIIFMVISSRADSISPVVSLVLLFAASLSEIIYAIYVDDFMWFFTEPRWWWCAINFIVFAFCTVAQMVVLIGLTKSMSDDKAELGIYSVPVAFVLGIVLSFINDGQYMPWLLIAFLTAQLIQAGIIFYEMRHSIALALACSVTYLTGIAATIIIAAVLVYVIIIIAIAVFVLMAFAHNDDHDLNLKNIGSGLYEDQHGNLWKKG